MIGKVSPGQFRDPLPDNVRYNGVINPPNKLKIGDTEELTTFPVCADNSTWTGV